jgi:hypothetical protein
MSDISEIIYVLGAVVLFSLFAITINKSMVVNTETTVESEIEYNAIAIAQSIIDQARQRAFDEVMVGKNILELNARNSLYLTSTDSKIGFSQVLKAESGESYPNYDDFDDFKLSDLTFATEYGNFTVNTTISYVDVTFNPTDQTYTVTNSSSRTYHKRLVATVTHPSLADPVSLEYIKTFY